MLKRAKEVYLATRDLLDLGISAATIYRNVRDGRWIARTGKRDGRYGQPPKEILLSSLPLDLQLKWAKLEENRASAVKDEDASHPDQAPDDDRLQRLQAALARFSPPQYTPDHRRAVEMRCIEMSRLADQSLIVIAKLKRDRKFTIPSPGSSKAGPGRDYHPDLLALVNRAVSSDPIYLSMYPSAANSPSVGTWLKLLDRYRKDGPVVFIRQTQTLSPSVDERFLQVSQDAVEWLQNNLKSYAKSSVTDFGKKWLAWAKKNSIKVPFTEHRPGKPGTCYTWLYRWRQRVPATTMTLVTKGERGFEASIAYIVRDYSELRPRDGFTMDWKIFDVECWQPARKGGGVPQLARLWLCPVFDLASRAVFGYHIQDRPSARGVTLAYLNAISAADWKNEPGLEMLKGMQRTREEQSPAFVHFDNGKDYRAQSVKGHDVEIKGFDLESGLVTVLSTYKIGLAAEVGITVRHAKPFNAKSKIVEPWFRYGVGRWEEGLPGFKGNKPDNKPHHYAAARRIHEAFCKGRAPKSEDLRQLPPLWREVYEKNRKEYGYGTPFLIESEFKAEFLKFLLEYLRSPHGSLTNDRGEMSPLDYLNLNADTPHMLTDLSTASLLMEPRMLSVARGELVVQWGGEKFVYREVSSDLSDGGAIYRLPNKTKVEFRYDPNSVGRALVISMGAPVCWVEQPELLGWNARQSDFEVANARKRLARRVANEFFETRAQAPDWRDEADSRRNVVEMRSVVNGPDQVIESDDSSEAVMPHRLAEVIVPTRFDRKPSLESSGATGGTVSPLRILKDSTSEEEWTELPEPATDSPPHAKDEEWVEGWE